MKESEFMERRLTALVTTGIVLFGLLAIASSSYYIVEPGYTAIHLRLGSMLYAHIDSGAYFKFPVIDSVILINNRICKTEIETTSLSKDLQTVKTEVAINFRINDAMQLYKTVGTNFDAVILNPFSQESIKAITARFTAEDLIRLRDTVKEEVFVELKKRLDPVFIELVDFNFVHLDFTPEFIRAVEDKQIAEQSAKTAHNLTEKVKEEMLQAKLRADAEVYALNAKKLAVTPQLIALKKADAFIKAIEKWDGKLPNYMGSTTPLLSITEQ
jgi:regulator of protease activity HflC (stomatin/prohibitin superfamily)